MSWVKLGVGFFLCARLRSLPCSSHGITSTSALMILQSVSHPATPHILRPYVPVPATRSIESFSWVLDACASWPSFPVITCTSHKLLREGSVQLEFRGPPPTPTRPSPKPAPLSRHLNVTTAYIAGGFWKPVSNSNSLYPYADPSFIGPVVTLHPASYRPLCHLQ